MTVPVTVPVTVPCDSPCDGTAVPWPPPRGAPRLRTWTEAGGPSCPPGPGAPQKQTTRQMRALSLCGIIQKPNGQPGDPECGEMALCPGGGWSPRTHGAPHKLTSRSSRSGPQPAGPRRCPRRGRSRGWPAWRRPGGWSWGDRGLADCPPAKGLGVRSAKGPGSRGRLLTALGHSPRESSGRPQLGSHPGP